VIGSSRVGLARDPLPAYLGRRRGQHDGCLARSRGPISMAPPSTIGEAGPDQTGPGRTRPVLGTLVWSGLASLAALTLVGAGVLWWHYGTAVFFQVLAAGLAACF